MTYPCFTGPLPCHPQPVQTSCIAQHHNRLLLSCNAPGPATSIRAQPWRSFKPDGVILFSDILTPLPGIGVSFEIDDNKGPLLDDPIRSADQVRVAKSDLVRDSTDLNPAVAGYACSASSTCAE